MPLQFSFQDIAEEIDLIGRIAARFLSPGSTHVLHQLREDLEGIRGAAAGRRYPWEIPESPGLITEVSRGQYEGGSRVHKEHIFAQISLVWVISPLGQHGPKASRGRLFELGHLASTRVRLFRYSPTGSHQEVGMWRMEIADDASPGCYFHVQLMGVEKAIPFPRSIPIPRLPTFVATPAFVLEFVLAELFQDDWKREVLEDRGDIGRWRSLQLGKLSKFFQWQKDAISAASGSPWTALKAEQPAAKLFL